MSRDKFKLHTKHTYMKKNCGSGSPRFLILVLLESSLIAQCLKFSRSTRVINIVNSTTDTRMAPFQCNNSPTPENKILNKSISEGNRNNL